MGARPAEGGSGHLMDRRTDRAQFPSKGEGPPPRWGPQGCQGDLQLATCLVLMSPTMDGPRQPCRERPVPTLTSTGPGALGPAPRPGGPRG